MVANAMSANSPGSLYKSALSENAIRNLKPTSDGPMIWIQMHRIIDVFVTFR
jgi:hypothetical protein